MMTASAVQARQPARSLCATSTATANIRAA
jgi:hypothetical protein